MQYPLSELLQEVGLDGREFLVLAEVDDKLAVTAFPSYPALDERSAAKQPVGQCRLAEGRIALRRAFDPDDTRPECLARLIAGKETLGVEVTVFLFLGRVVALVEGSHAKQPALAAEVFQFVFDGINVHRRRSARYLEL